MKKSIRNRIFSKCSVKYGKGKKAISNQKRMEAYRRNNAAMTDIKLLMYAKNLYR